MKLTILCVFLACTFPALGQNPLPVLKDGTVIDEKTEFRHDGPLLIAGKVKLKGISLDLRGPTTLAPGADLELDDVHIRVSDPPGSPNGTSGLLCDGPAKISIRHSTLTVEGGPRGRSLSDDELGISSGSCSGQAYGLHDFRT